MDTYDRFMCVLLVLFGCVLSMAITAGLVENNWRQSMIAAGYGKYYIDEGTNKRFMLYKVSEDGRVQRN